MINIVNALDELKRIDGYLEPFFGDIALHLERYNSKRKSLLGRKSIESFANGHMFFGFHRTETGWVFRECLDGADNAWLCGDFNNWDKFQYPLTKKDGGVWELELDGENALIHGQYVKLIVEKDGKVFERVPSYIRRAAMDTRTYTLCGQVWCPPEPFVWTDGDFFKKIRHKSPLIYEAHIGMAQEKNGIGTYREFADVTLEWIKKAGYNVIQLMAIQEHPYYASFGYQVTNFFAPSHRFGTPEDLKYLINKAHQLGISVLLDVVHSHASANVGEGLNLFDGTEDQYFLSGSRGWHSAWGTKCFDYGKDRVLHYLLSNLKYWQEEFHFDGFRFDGVTSMLYENHGLGVAFTDYSQYFSMNTNVDARVYLMLANELIHKINKRAITVSEEMSGMPGMCLPLKKAGFGFDYRLSMGIPDMWIKLIKDQRIEDWDMFYVWHELVAGRYGEKTIGYCESHDQAMVGDKTIVFRLADAEMYYGMDKTYHSQTIDTAMDMHKLIRLVTASAANDGYLNFMGNEFGHPEWIDFPREGNGWSYHYARRQWSLVNKGIYKYSELADFDRDMIELLKSLKIYDGEKAKSIWLDQTKKIIIFKRGDAIFAFNLHPNMSQPDFFINCSDFGKSSFEVALSSDKDLYGGQNRIQTDYIYRADMTESGIGFKIYLPCRTALVLRKIK